MFQLCTIVVEYMVKMKTTFDFNFNFIMLLNSMDTPKHGNKEKLTFKKYSLGLLVNLYFETCLIKIKTLKVQRLNPQNGLINSRFEVQFNL